MVDRVGQQLGSYRLIRLLGECSFAEVYLGEHIYLGTQTAIKVLVTSFPTRKSQVFSTSSDNQTAIDIYVLQGEHDLAKDNKYLAFFRLDGIPLAQRGVPLIEVMFDIDSDGVVHISARDKGTGRDEHITVTPSKDPLKTFQGYFPPALIPLKSPSPPLEPTISIEKDADQKKLKQSNQKKSEKRQRS